MCLTCDEWIYEKRTRASTISIAYGFISVQIVLTLIMLFFSINCSSQTVFLPGKQHFTNLQIKISSLLNSRTHTYTHAWRCLHFSLWIASILSNEDVFRKENQWMAQSKLHSAHTHNNGTIEQKHHHIHLRTHSSGENKWHRIYDYNYVMCACTASTEGNLTIAI